jgi:coatomer subunit gamma
MLICNRRPRFISPALLHYFLPSAAACDSIIEILNLEPLGGSQTPTSTSVHALQLSGLLSGGGGKVLVRCRMTFARGQGVTLELGVRAEKQEACDLVVAAIGG